MIRPPGRCRHPPYADFGFEEQPPSRQGKNFKMGPVNERRLAMPEYGRTGLIADMVVNGTPEPDVPSSRSVRRPQRLKVEKEKIGNS
jgi:hypothetical protein